MSTITPEIYTPDPRLYPELQGNIDGFSESSIRPEDTSKATEILIGNYANKIRAAIRETVINALDSRAEAHSAVPVRIHAPSPEEPWLEVTDEGLGLSTEGIVNVFTRPTASDKENNPHVTGTLGIGAKAPYTVTNRFEVIGTKNGVSTHAVLIRADGRLLHKVLRVDQTDDPDGVSVKVPVDPEKTMRWEYELVQLNFVWEPGSVEITNTHRTLRTYRDEELSLTESLKIAYRDDELGLTFVPSNTMRKMVIMGGIEYPVNTFHVNENTVTHMGNGIILADPKALDFVATRESLQNSDHNNEKITTIIEKWHEHVAVPIIENIEAMTDLVAREKEYRRIKKTIPFLKTSSVSARALSHLGKNIDMLIYFPDEKMKATGDALRKALEPIVNPDFEPNRKYKVEGGFDYTSRGRRAKYIPEHIATGPKGTVFVDTNNLSITKQKMLNRWSRQENVIVILAPKEELSKTITHVTERYRIYNRDRTEELFFLDGEAIPTQDESTARLRKERMDDRAQCLDHVIDPQTYVFVENIDEDIEWVDHADIVLDTTSVSAPAFDPSTDTINVYHYWTGNTTKKISYQEIEAVLSRKTRPGWVVLSTKLNQEKFPVIPTEGIIVMPPKNASLDLIRQKFPKRVISAMTFFEKPLFYLASQLTPVEKSLFLDGLALMSVTDRASAMVATMKNLSIAQMIEDPQEKAGFEAIEKRIREIYELKLHGRKDVHDKITIGAKAIVNRSHSYAQTVPRDTEFGTKKLYQNSFLTGFFDTFVLLDMIKNNVVVKKRVAARAVALTFHEEWARAQSSSQAG